VSHLLTISVWRKLLWSALCLFLLAIGFTMTRHSALPLFSPARLVADAALGQRTWFALPVLAGISLFAGVGAIWSFRSSLVSTARDTFSRKRFASLTLPGQLGGLVAKDFRYFRRLLDFHLGIAVTLLGHVYLLSAGTPNVNIFLSLLIVVFLV